MAIAIGCSPSELAEQLKVIRSTIRSQLASTFAMTQPRRHSEFVTLLARVAILPLS